MSDAMSDASHEALRDLHGAVRERIADAVLKQHPGGASVDTIVNATIDAIPTVLAEPAQPEGLTEKVAALPDASRLVRQRGDDDCEIAATAMVLRCSYEDAARRLEWDDDGHRSPIDVISEHGIAARLVCAAKQTGVVWPPEPMANLHYCRVLPRADAPHAHAVVMLADGSVLDPWTDEPKRLTDYPAVYEVWVLGEPKADEAEGRVTDPTSEPAQQVDTIPADFDANFIRDMADKYEHDSMNRRWPGSLPHRGFADIAKALRYALAVAQHGGQAPPPSVSGMPTDDEIEEKSNRTYADDGVLDPGPYYAFIAGAKWMRGQAGTVAIPDRETLARTIHDATSAPWVDWHLLLETYDDFGTGGEAIRKAYATADAIIALLTAKT